MVDRIVVERIVRKTLEIQLSNARADLLAAVPVEHRDQPVFADGFPIWWPNMTFHGQKDETRPPFYCRFSFHPSPPRTRSTGINPRIMLRGHCIVGCFVPQGMGEDPVDDLVNVVLAHYPLANEKPDGTTPGVLNLEGFATFIESVDPKPAFGAFGRYYRPVHINWHCWKVET